METDSPRTDLIETADTTDTTKLNSILNKISLKMQPECDVSDNTSLNEKDRNNWARRVSNAEKELANNSIANSLGSSNSSQYEDVENTDEITEDIQSNENQDKDETKELNSNCDRNSVPNKQNGQKKRKDPAYIPRTGYYFEHDSREDDQKSEKGNQETPTDAESQLGNSEPVVNSNLASAKSSKPPTSIKNGNIKQRRKNFKKKFNSLDVIEKDIDNTDRWKHDRFDLDEQQPKSENEIVKRYGFDIRKAKDVNEIMIESNVSDDKKYTERAKSQPKSLKINNKSGSKENNRRQKFRNKLKFKSVDEEPTFENNINSSTVDENRKRSEFKNFNQIHESTQNNRSNTKNNNSKRNGFRNNRNYIHFNSGNDNKNIRHTQTNNNSFDDDLNNSYNYFERENDYEVQDNLNKDRIGNDLSKLRRQRAKNNEDNKNLPRPKNYSNNNRNNIEDDYNNKQYNEQQNNKRNNYTNPRNKPNERGYNNRINNNNRNFSENRNQVNGNHEFQNGNRRNTNDRGLNSDNNNHKHDQDNYQSHQNCPVNNSSPKKNNQSKPFFKPKHLQLEDSVMYNQEQKIFDKASTPVYENHNGKMKFNYQPKFRDQNGTENNEMPKRYSSIRNQKPNGYQTGNKSLNSSVLINQPNHSNNNGNLPNSYSQQQFVYQNNNHRQGYHYEQPPHAIPIQQQHNIPHQALNINPPPQGNPPQYYYVQAPPSTIEYSSHEYANTAYNSVNLQSNTMYYNNPNQIIINNSHQQRQSKAIPIVNPQPNHGY